MIRKLLFFALIAALIAPTACKKDKFAKDIHDGFYNGNVVQFDLSDSSTTVLSDSFTVELRKAGLFKYEVISPDESILPSMVFKSKGATRDGVVFAVNPRDEAWYMFIDYTFSITGLAIGKTGEYNGEAYPEIFYEGWKTE